MFFEVPVITSHTILKFSVPNEVEMSILIKCIPLFSDVVLYRMHRYKLFDVQIVSQIV